MRHGRRNGLSHDFGGSGEDSFVAVVVTKLTGALLFILLLTMVIMALIPRAEVARRPSHETEQGLPLAITTPEALPEAIAGRPYAMALAARGGNGPLKWRVGGELPEGLELDAASGQIHGTPSRGTPGPVEVVLTVSDETDRVSKPARLVVYQPDRPLALASRLSPGLPPVPWRAWAQQGFGFLLLLLVHLVGMNSLASLEGRRPEAGRRFVAYRWIVRLASLGAAAGLAAWLVLQRAP
jgi:hypothetical protein